MIEIKIEIQILKYFPIFDNMKSINLELIYKFLISILIFEIKNSIDFIQKFNKFFLY